ncbi:MAG: hypothetical protein FWD60_07760 [Candidatus Azobacteroides sp.]|nr:hypothetical protein [Candidatus Azobacteroides sp.]
MIENIDFFTPLSVTNKMRLGPKGDGGYIVYRPSLFNCDILMTYGVGWDVNFEVDFYNLTNKKIFMYDPTMFGDKYIDRLYSKRLIKILKFQKLYEYLRFSYNWGKYFKYLQQHDVIFYNEGLANKKSGKYDTFQNHLIKNNITTEKILLKMDIEENEYSILSESDIYIQFNNVDQIIIEFHNLKNRLRELKTIISQLKEMYEIVHIHGNNNSDLFTLYKDHGNDISFPDVVEVTLVKKESILSKDVLYEKIDYPCKNLDYPNTPCRPDFIKLKFK